ncbi:hypothetical protein P8845_00450 [Bacillus spizizenii]|nr:hypothetical protein [Bacillus spizizenii]MCY9255598.1 hypothetical protein [Bacillus spizizenii]MEC0609067.1 hypothetical protein [Bacillus spizizenii]
MNKDNIRIKDRALIDYALNSFSAIKEYVSSEFENSHKVTIDESTTIGFLFLQQVCKIYYFDNNERIIYDVKNKHYEQFITDTIIQKFKELSIPEYVSRYQAFSKEQFRKEIIDLLQLGKFKFALNPALGQVECLWKKPKISFLLDSEFQFYNVLSD